MKKKIVMVGGVLLLLIILISSLSKNSEVQKSFEEGKKQAEQNLEKPAVTYTLSADAKAIGISEVEVSGKTNLPDGAVIEISAVRIFTFLGETDTRSGLAGRGFSLTPVSSGKFNVNIKLDDKKFLEDIKISGEKIQLEPNIGVEVVFNPKQNQNANVIKAIGENGEFLESSPNKEVFGSKTDNPYNTLEVELKTPLAFPYQNP